MRTILTLLLGCCLLIPQFSQAQKKLPWRKRAKMAKDFEKSGDFYQAAVYYEGVFDEKPDKEEYIYKAGNCYYLLRDYANAVKCLEKVKDKNDDYDKPGFKYALALKQTGNAEEAKKAFSTFIGNYNGDDKSAIQKSVDIEIQGCDFAMNAESSTNPEINIDHLDAKINTNKTEFAPIPFNDDVLYFSSTISGVAKVYRTQLSGDNWSRPQTPNIFVGKMERSHFGNGSFTEDGKRFYFTQCDLADGKADCAIYVMLESAGGWSDPVMLPDYINAEDANTTHPFVLTQGDKEIIYFVSDKEGGRGGLDLWFTTRSVSSSSNNYTLPKNLGRNINTSGDDITPYYDKKEGVLYFSSNGRVSAGGLDIFKSKGEKLQWEVSQNLGFPINSSADDLYYHPSEAHGGGYFVSNRLLAPKKVATTDDDIFYFGEKRIDVTIGGLVSSEDDPDNEPLTDINAKLFLDDELLEDRMINDGKYRFNLKPKNQYIVEISKEGYKVASFEVDTRSFEFSEDISKDIAMQPIEQPDPDPEPTPDPDPEPSAEDLKYAIVPKEYSSRDNPYIMPESPVDPLTGEQYTGEALTIYEDIMNNVASESPQGMVYWDGEDGDLLPYIEEDVVENTPEPEPDPEPTPDPEPDPVRTTEDVEPGEAIYKIQVAAVRRYKEYKYEKLNDVGKQIFEDIDGGLRRVMVVPPGADEFSGGYATKEEALDILTHVLNNTRFDRAFVIKYVNGERVGEGFRGLDEVEASDFSKDSDEEHISEDYEGF